MRKLLLRNPGAAKEKDRTGGRRALHLAAECGAPAAVVEAVMRMYPQVTHLAPAKLARLAKNCKIFGRLVHRLIILLATMQALLVGGGLA